MYKSIVFMCLLFAVVSARPNVAKEFRQHLKDVIDFPCRDPQRRVVTLEELGVPLAGITKMYHPDRTVLSRCDSMSGCCLQTGSSCSPATTEEVTLSFVVKDLLIPGAPETVETIVATNHTSCACSTLRN